MSAPLLFCSQAAALEKQSAAQGVPVVRVAKVSQKQQRREFRSPLQCETMRQYYVAPIPLAGELTSNPQEKWQKKK